MINSPPYRNINTSTETAWKWTPIACALDPIPMTAFYNADRANRGLYWDPASGVGTATNAVPLPKMIFLPLALGEFIASGQQTPFELRRFV